MLYYHFVLVSILFIFFFFSSRRRHTRYWRDWSSDVCSSDLGRLEDQPQDHAYRHQRQQDARRLDPGALEQRQGRRLLALLPGPEQCLGGLAVGVVGQGRGTGLPVDQPEIGRASCRERVEILV